MKDLGNLFAFSNVAYIVGPAAGGYIYSIHPYMPFTLGVATSIVSLVILQVMQFVKRSNSRLRKLSVDDLNLTLSSSYDDLDALRRNPLPAVSEQPTSSNNNMPTSLHRSISSPAFDAVVSSAIQAKSKDIGNPFLIHYLHLKFAYQIGISFFEAFFAQQSKYYVGLSERVVGLILAWYGTLSAFTNLVLIKRLLALPFTVDSWLFPLILVLGFGLYVWTLSKNLVLITIAASAIAISGNLLQSIVANRIAATQSPPVVHFHARTDSKDSSKPTNQSEPAPAAIPQRRRSTSISNDHYQTKVQPSRVSQSKRKKQKMGAVLGMQAAADRAARILSPIIGSYVLKYYKTEGLIYIALSVTLYCCSLLYLGPPVRLFQSNLLFPITKTKLH
jgi:hypothetical protein